MRGVLLGFACASGCVVKRLARFCRPRVGRCSLRFATLCPPSPPIASLSGAWRSVRFSVPRFARRSTYTLPFSERGYSALPLRFRFGVVASFIPRASPSGIRPRACELFSKVSPEPPPSCQQTNSGGFSRFARVARLLVCRCSACLLGRLYRAVRFAPCGCACASASLASLAPLACSFAPRVRLLSLGGRLGGGFRRACLGLVCRFVSRFAPSLPLAPLGCGRKKVLFLCPLPCV